MPGRRTSVQALPPGPVVPRRSPKLRQQRLTCSAGVRGLVGRPASASGSEDPVRADRTKLLHLDEDGARFTAVCLDHGPYEIDVDPENDAYLDLATLYRNLVKERLLVRDSDTLHVMLKGSDWAFDSQLVDGALGVLDTPGTRMPLRIFTPQVLAPTGAKLSKSLLRDKGAGALPSDVEPWMLDTTRWPGKTDHYVDALMWLVDELLTDPKHFFRSFTTFASISVSRDWK